MRQFTASSRWAASAAVLAIALAHAPAFAQTDESRAAARALATEGAAAFNEGRFKDAADLFARAESLLHAPPHLLFFARSSAKLGQFVRAREAYLKIIKEPLASNAPQAFRDAQVAAQDELRVVEPRIAKLTIQLEGAQDAKDLTVKVDGAVVPAVLVGVPQPIDPGEHRVDAVAVGKRAKQQQVVLKEGERSAIVLRLEADGSAVGAPLPAGPVTTSPTPGAGAAAPVTTPGPVASGALSTTPPPAADSGGGGSSGMRIGSYVAFGVGAVGIVGGGLLFLSGSKKIDRSNKLFDACAADGCGESDPRRAEVKDLDKQGTSQKTLGGIGLAVGGVGVGAGVLLFVLSSKSDSAEAPAATASLSPWIGANSLGLSGTF